MCDGHTFGHSLIQFKSNHTSHTVKNPNKSVLDFLTS